MNVIRENDLFDYGLKILQNEDAFKFSLDSILLAEFVDIKLTTKNILDLCSGNCSIPLILSTKTKAHLSGIELQKSVFELGNESIRLNKLENQITFINDDLKNFLNYFNYESIDIITVNPPYFKYMESSIISKNEEKSIARYEITTNLESIIEASFSLLKTKGSLYLVHRPERLSDIISMLSKHKFSVNKLQFVYTNKQNNASIVLVEAIKNGSSELKVRPSILVDRRKTYKNIFD